ncbi:MAG: alpha/beta fold hydrolase [Polyangiaceae bacterium]|nr:alpha/beta fold hydrolase [Polyangiaceae bacterium]
MLRAIDGATQFWDMASMFSIHRGALFAVLSLGFGCSSAPPPNCPNPATAAVKPVESGAPVSTFRVAGEDKSPIAFERMAAFPEPGWNVPRALSFSPDKKNVYFLASEGGGTNMVLHAFDLEKKTSSVVLRAKDLLASDKPLSREEELRRERQRQRATGISSYVSAENENVMVVPLGGDLFLRDAKGKVSQLTQTAEAEIDPKVCKRGEKVVFVRGSELYSIEPESKRETQLTKGATAGVTRGQSDFNGQEEMDEPSGFWISPTWSKVLYLEVDENGVDKVPILGFRDKKPDFMEQRYPEAGKKNPVVRLGLLDMSSKKTTWVSLPTKEERYFGRVVWAPDGSAVFFQALSRDQKQLTLYRVDSKAGTATELVTEKSPVWIEFVNAQMLQKSPHLLWLVPRDGHIHIETRDRATGKVVAQLTKGAWDVTRVQAVDEEHGHVYFTATKDSPVERHLYKVALTGGEPVKLTAERGVHNTTVEPKGGAYVDIHSALDRAPQAVIRDLTGAILGALPVQADPDMASLGIRPKEIVTIKSESGDTLYGALLKPRQMEAGAKHPVVVMVYGGPGAQTVIDQWSPSLFWQHLAQRGFVVFQLDNRGSAGRGPAFEHPIYGKLGKLELADQLAGVSYLKALPFVDGGRIGIYGHSYGGTMAALAMLAAPGVFKAAVSASPVTRWGLYDTGYTERYMGLPASNAEGYDSTDLTKMAKNLQGKLLLIHAMMDENVHFQHTAELMDALVQANKPFDTFVLPGERHGYRNPVVRAYVSKKVAGYFADNL